MLEMPTYKFAKVTRDGKDFNIEMCSKDDIISGLCVPVPGVEGEVRYTNAELVRWAREPRNKSRFWVRGEQGWNAKKTALYVAIETKEYNKIVEGKKLELSDLIPVTDELIKQFDPMR